MAKVSAIITSVTPSITRTASTSSRRNLGAGALLLLATQLLALAPTRADGLSITLLLRTVGDPCQDWSILTPQVTTTSGNTSLEPSRGMPVFVSSIPVAQPAPADWNEAMTWQGRAFPKGWKVRYHSNGVVTGGEEDEGVILKVYTSNGGYEYLISPTSAPTETETKSKVFISHNKILQYSRPKRTASIVNGIELEVASRSESPAHPLPQPAAAPQAAAASRAPVAVTPQTIQKPAAAPQTPSYGCAPGVKGIMSPRTIPSSSPRPEPDWSALAKSYYGAH